MSIRTLTTQLETNEAEIGTSITSSLSTKEKTMLEKLLKEEEELKSNLAKVSEKRATVYFFSLLLHSFFFPHFLFSLFNSRFFLHIKL